MNVFKIGWRNVWRSRRRSLVTIAALSFALWAELIYAGLLPGYIQGMEEDVVDLEVGDIQIMDHEYHSTPSIYSTVPNKVVSQVEDMGFIASPKLLGGGLGASGEASAGVSLKGIDVIRDSKASNLHKRVEVGDWLDSEDPKGVVLGKRLAKNLDCSPGNELLVLSQASDGSMANSLYVVRGILGSVGEATDRSSVYMTEGAFRELMVLDEGFHQVVVRRGKTELQAAEVQLQDVLGSEINVMTWKELLPIVAQMLDSTQSMIYIVFLIIYLAVGILILNAMLTAVFERIREFGVLKALGAGPGYVFSLIMVESGIQAIVAMAVAFVFALPVMFYLTKYGIDVGALAGMDMMGVAMRTVWYGVYTPEVLAAPIILLWLVVGGAVAYPAIKAALISPINAMKHR